MSDDFDALDVFVLMITFLIEILGIVFAFVGESFSFILDIIGVIAIGGWRKIKRKKSKKFYFAFLGELIPYLGAFFFWLWYLLSDLTSAYGKKS